MDSEDFDLLISRSGLNDFVSNLSSVLDVEAGLKDALRRRGRDPDQDWIGEGQDALDDFAPSPRGST